MSDRQDDPFDVHTALVRTAAKQLIEQGGAKIRPGLELNRILDASPVVSVEGKWQELEDISHDVGVEIMDAAKKQRQEKKDAENAKYLNPASNPMIRTLPED